MISTNGGVFRLKVVEIDRVIGSKVFVTSLILFCLFLAVVDPFLFKQRAALPFRVIYWVLNGVIVVGGWYVQFRALVWLRVRMQRDFVVPSVILIVISIILVTFSNYGLASQVFGVATFNLGDALTDSGRYSIVAILFELGVAMFLLPRLLAAMRPADRTDPVTETKPPIPDPTGSTIAAPAMLEVNGRLINAGTLLYLKSAEHYVEVVMEDTRELIRASLRDVVDMLHPDLGVQTHRSYWVNGAAIVGLNRVKGAQFLVLSNGEEIPVSRQRRDAVQDWVRRTVAKPSR